VVSSRFIEPILRRIFPSASLATIAAMHNLIRKAAHFTDYAILSGCCLAVRW